MKVVLIKDVKGVGHTHETVDALAGYALNYLIPKNLAVFATARSMKEAQMRQKQSINRKELDVGLIAQNIATLADARIVIKAKANEKGHLYNAVGEPEIRKAAEEQAHVDLPRASFKIEKPIKELGTFDVPVAVGDVFGKFSVTIEAE
ncbi:50S ribosomal protein L9 [Patescibacteria group bacterium]|nr:50S ribosomal protein L9 [Patescibacteria group bacterium]MDE2021898.1 50S ribosomal protein L9 [Patescibacteria group bacterium]MDE2173150.1 50S ribosomal protein L9 [Patescibacteria group bacterium]